MNTTQIGVIGAGELGQAIGHSLERAGSQVLYYDREDQRTTTASISDIVDTCQLLLICVPSWANREVAREIAKHSNPQRLPLVLSFSKGVEKGFVTMDQVLHDTLTKGTPYGLVYGPMLANEMVGHLMSSGVMALSEAGYGPELAVLFGKAKIYLESSSDLHGVAISGALKNLYAISFGVCDGLKMGANARGRLAVIVLREMKRILQANGAVAETAEGLAGLGDLVAAGTSDGSFNYRVGRSIAEGIADINVKSEGLAALEEVKHIIEVKDYPVIAMLDKLIYHYGDPHEFRNILEF